MTNPRRIIEGAIARTRARLEGPRALPWILGAALFLLLPCLCSGLFLDDYVHLGMLGRGGSIPEMEREPWNLFAFLLDDEGWREAVRERGVLPWYASPDIHATFFRPLSSLTRYVDHLVAPRAPILWHAHSLAWYALLVLAVSRIYGRLFTSPRLVALATLLYAVDDAHGFPTAWIANRNALIATAIGALAIALHLAWRETSCKRCAVAAPLLFGLALLGGEAALGLGAYAAAFALTLDRGSRASRLLSLVPLGLVVVAWRIVYDLLGYGVGGSDLYIDPASEPGSFLAAVGSRVPALLMGQLTLFWSQWSFFASLEMRPWVTAFALLVVAAFAFFARRLLRASATARFAAVGMVLSAVPMAATFPHDRLLFGAGIGGFALIAEAIASRRDKSVGSPRLGAFLIATHLVVAPISLPFNALAGLFFSNAYGASATTLDRLGDLQNKTVVVVNAPDYFFACWPPVFREQLGLSVPAKTRVLGTTHGAVVVTRLRSDTLRLVPEDSYVSSSLDRLMRKAERCFQTGDRFDLGDFSIEVERLTPDCRPASIVVRMKTPPDDPRFLWTAWWPDGYGPFELPAVGESIAIPGFGLEQTLKMGFFGTPKPE